MTELRNQHFVISDEMSNLGKDYRLMKTFKKIYRELCKGG